MNIRATAWAPGVAGLFVLISACGGSSGPPSCAKVGPCGGDIVGTWNVVGGCLDGPALNAQLMSRCPGGNIRVTGYTVSGSLTFGADMTYTSSALTETLSTTQTVPDTCLSGMTCADLDAAVQADPAASGNCLGTSTCTCTVVTTRNLVGQSGTYAVDGTTVAIAPAAGNQNASPYCVQGDLLHLLQLDSTMPVGPMGEARIVTDVVSRRQ